LEYRDRSVGDRRYHVDELSAGPVERSACGGAEPDVCGHEQAGEVKACTREDHRGTDGNTGGVACPGSAWQTNCDIGVQHHYLIPDTSIK